MYGREFGEFPSNDSRAMTNASVLVIKKEQIVAGRTTICSFLFRTDHLLNDIEPDANTSPL